MDFLQGTTAASIILLFLSGSECRQSLSELNTFPLPNAASADAIFHVPVLKKKIRPAWWWPVPIGGDDFFGADPSIGDLSGERRGSPDEPGVEGEIPSGEKELNSQRRLGRWHG
ncbi:hypothetical protein NE237_030831 [Protea cynaroides]|uniref:Uncharacterized protein n=1 Tax=Protea cynaroides TaxID=273540 RepID=A0A9Q0GUV7_9MAGN|nr:hypothetical protein NE237_030831 [Protea cynaroides]